MLKVDSPSVFFVDDYLISGHDVERVEVVDETTVRPVLTHYHLRTDLKVPRVGVMLVGWGGNNGTTLTCGLYAQKLGLEWKTRVEPHQKVQWLGSISQCGTLSLTPEKWVPIKSVLPMLEPSDIVVGGWDICGTNLYEASVRNQVVEPALLDQLRPVLSNIGPLPGVYFPDFIASNQSERANNILVGTKHQILDKLIGDINRFKGENSLEKIVVMWTATTERYCKVSEGVNDTKNNLLKAIDEDNPEVSPSTLYAVAALMSNSIFLNGSPQNTLVPGVIELAEHLGGYVAGNDFKTGQTKIKSVLADYLVSSGFKLRSIVSYNHLGNNDGRNLSSEPQFTSKEISKRGVVEDVVAAARGTIYAEGEKGPDHVIVIKYVPSVGDSKRALDEYESEIFLGGRNTLSLHNVCEDSLLAAPVMLDLIIFAELFSRVSSSTDKGCNWKKMHHVMSILSYFFKAPMVPEGAPVVNVLFKQRECIENFLRALVGLGANTHMLFEDKFAFAKK